MRHVLLVLDPHQDEEVAEQRFGEALTEPPAGLAPLGSIGGDVTAAAVGWRALDGPARAVRLNSDREFGAACVRLNAERPADLVAIRTLVSRVLPICPVEVVRERARTPEGWPRSVVMLMVATGRPVSEDDLYILKAALRVPDVRVRVAAATEAALARTPALVGTL
jgi:hypothetical protein